MMSAGIKTETVYPEQEGPFSLGNDEVYKRWRDWKLEAHPRTAGDLVVEITDPFDISNAEYTALLDRISRANMALYVTRAVDAEKGKELIRAIARRIGIKRMDANMLADDDGITPLTVIEEGRRSHYIPYTNRPIDWHTDGYYNTLDRQNRSLNLYCVQDSETGGENAVMDHEIAYILMRDKNPNYIQAFMHPNCMTIPANVEHGREIREARTGPVFSVNAGDGTLHMRYTARKRNILWRDDPATLEAVAFLENLTGSNSPYIFRHRQAPGHGLISTNVLHDRAGFEDSVAKKRLIYRARYYDRIKSTTLAEVWPG
jgi:hypothetical protein